MTISKKRRGQGSRSVIVRAAMGLIAAAGLLGQYGCATPAKDRATYDRINAELAQDADKARAGAVQPEAVSAALLPPLKIEAPRTGKPLEQKFDLVVNNAPANQVFMGIVSGTRYSMLLHPDVSGTLSANLKDVTVFEALDAIRELYGYDYKVEGTRIFIQPLTMRTRVFTVNYISGERKGTSSTRVISGSVSDVPSGSSGGTAAPTTTAPGGASRAQDSSKITTTSSSDFWTELKTTLAAIVGAKEGTSVVVSPQAGIVAVRAMPEELRNVERFLKAAQLSVDRQVMLEAKILEVQLNDGFQTGINWAAFKTGPNSRVSLGLLQPGSTLNTSGNLVGTPVSSAPGSTLASANTAVGTLIGLAFQTSNFAALLSFLETQGTVHVLSSPRIATLNNQKAVLKVGTDDFFVTNVSTTTTTTGTTGTTTPSVTLQPFFSGIALDVTPQIDEDGNIILHVHPSISQVTTVNKVVDLGAGVGVLTLPLASSNISETDSIVRAQDGSVVALGGLMRQAQTDDRSQVPGVGDVPVVGALFRNTSKVVQKRELVILLKPTVIRGGNNWTEDILQSRQRMQALDPGAAGQR
ncbi:MAG: pilus (MSHA type) biogenesis protein MshL [Sulfuricella sp.]|nr:pilus (MSHA type) biogenesis protein MshL [Sulfuricella sp.]